MTIHTLHYKTKDSTKDAELSELQQQLNVENENDHQSSYLQLLQQREEENRQEVSKLTSEIRSLKLQIIQLKSKTENNFLYIKNPLFVH